MTIASIALHYNMQLVTVAVAVSMQRLVLHAVVDVTCCSEAVKHSMCTITAMFIAVIGATALTLQHELWQETCGSRGHAWPSSQY